MLIELFAWMTGIVAIGALSLYYLLDLMPSSRAKSFWSSNGVTSFGCEEMGSFWVNHVGKRNFVEVTTKVYNKFRPHKIPYAGTMKFVLPNLWLFDLDVIKHVLVKDFENFVNRSTQTMDNADPHLHLMLLFKENQEWKDLRSTMSPTFTTGRIREMFHVFHTSGSRMLKYLQEKCELNNGQVNMSDTMGRLAMDVIAGAAFGVESHAFEQENSIFNRMGNLYSFKVGPILVLKAIFHALFPSFYKRCGLALANAEADAFFTHIIKSAIQHRQETGEKRNDFLHLMLQTREGKLVDEKSTDSSNDKDSSRNQKKVDLSDDSIVAQSLLFILGGFDTMTIVLNFSAYMLAFHPEKQEILAKEVKKSLQDSGTDFPSYEQISEMQYLNKFVSETLRMYPPAIFVNRACAQDYKIPGTNSVIPKGTLVEIPIYAIHHDPEHFPNPSKFDPERFNAHTKDTRHPYAYMPFGHGPRNCIATRFAIMEVKTMVAILAYNFKIEPTSQTPSPSQLKFSGSSTNLKASEDFILKIIPRRVLKLK